MINIVRRLFGIRETEKVRNPNDSGRPVTYLYILRASQPPSQEMMHSVLEWWKGRNTPNFRMLGGQQVSSVPSNPDTYVVGLMFGIGMQYGFDTSPESLGYSTIHVAAETIGVCRFVNQPELTAKEAPVQSGPKETDGVPACSSCRTRLVIVSSDAIGTLYGGVVCPACTTLVCSKCRGNPVSGPCKTCGEPVRPAYADILASLQKS